MNIKTIGELRKSGYQSKPIKEEMRDNLINKIKLGEPVFPGILGFGDTVLPDIERAILSRHNVLLLGLRGQAKTRIARLMTNLLDEFIPVVAGSEINDDPYQPISRYARDLIRDQGEDTPIEWLHRSKRYVEKLATPDVSVADLIGDLDPIKAANLRIPYGDERVLHFGLIPRAHRSIFVINELPDLQPRIQVALFNILQEGDIQIRGFKVRLPLDISFVFTANPEDYTNRGSIITPLKDRIESQILTHYPTSLQVARQITEQEARITKVQKKQIRIPELVKNILERIAFHARESEYIDEKSGVSARLSITGYENLVSTAERRMLRNNEESTQVRIIDFWGVVPAITGKVELVYEGEQEGPYQVALKLLGLSIKDEFLTHFPHPAKEERRKNDLFQSIRHFFSDGQELNLENDEPDTTFIQKLSAIPGLEKIVMSLKMDKKEKFAYMELLLHGLTEFNVLNKEVIGSSMTFNDLLANMLDELDEE